MGRKNANHTDFIDYIMFYMLFIVGCFGHIFFYFTQITKGYGIIVDHINATRTRPDY